MKPLDWAFNVNYSGQEIREHLANIPELFDADSALPLLSQHPEWEVAPAELGFDLTLDDCLVVPGSAPLTPVATANHLGERIFVYPYGFILVLSQGNAFRVVKLEK